jgi:hypothetical protein
MAAHGQTLLAPVVWYWHTLGDRVRIKRIGSGLQFVLGIRSTERSSTGGHLHDPTPRSAPQYSAGRTWMTLPFEAGTPPASCVACATLYRGKWGTPPCPGNRGLKLRGYARGSEHASVARTWFVSVAVGSTSVQRLGRSRGQPVQSDRLGAVSTSVSPSCDACALRWP